MSAGRQKNGLTRCNSPVYLQYPPDSSGRRPSELSNIQYNNPYDRAADQARRSAERQEIGLPQLNRDSLRPTQATVDRPYAIGAAQSLTQTSQHPLPYNQSSRPQSQTSSTSQGPRDGSPSTHSSYQSPNVQQQQRTTHRYPPLESRDNGPPRTHRIWYCTQPGCPYRGPYLEKLYDNCALGCHAPKSECSDRKVIAARPGF